MSGFVMMPKFRKFVYIPAAMLSLDCSQDIEPWVFSNLHKKWLD